MTTYAHEVTTYAHEDLKKIFHSHAKWLRGEDGGKRADLRSANLQFADLRSADLQFANLRSADLQFADLRSADLRSADLQFADLQFADLRSADLQFADLQFADLRSADLRSADLRSADLQSADLQKMVLSDGVTWEEYLCDVVPALLSAGGKDLAAIVTPETWECHAWTNCPMVKAFGVHDLTKIPALYRWQAERFIQFFDAGLIPMPDVSARRIVEMAQGGTDA